MSLHIITGTVGPHLVGDGRGVGNGSDYDHYRVYLSKNVSMRHETTAHNTTTAP